MKTQRHTLRALALLLSYPDERILELLPLVADALDAEGALRAPRRLELRGFARSLARMDPIEAQMQFVELFDRGRSTSLHLFEHVHGDSRERGPAMIDLVKTYETAGLLIAPHEVPDHLCVVLEFASTQPPAVAREFLGEMAHILNAIFGALRQRESAYASVLGALLDLAGEQAQPVAPPVEEPLDESWAEPVVFDGCSSKGQARPGQAQPVHIVRKSGTASIASGASS